MEYRFRKTEHPEQGCDGWLLEGAPSTYEPLHGMGVAHDLLEHRANDDGSVEDELLALGAALYVRGEGGYWHQFTQSHFDPGENVAPDLARLATEFGGLEGLHAPGGTRALGEQVEDWIAHALRDARSVLVDEYEQDHREVDEYLTRVRGWLRKGYRESRRRWRACTSAELAYAFHRIESEADRLLRHAEPWEVLVVRRTGCSVQVYLDEHWD